MNTEAIAANLEDHLVDQGRLAGDDPVGEPGVDSLVGSMGPAIRLSVL